MKALAYVGFIAAVAALGACESSQQMLGRSTPPTVKRNFEYCNGHQQGFSLPKWMIQRNHRKSSVDGLTPADIQAAYDLPSQTKGSGQIVALLEICDDPNIVSDIATYRSQFGLPSAKLDIFNQDGQQYNYPPASTIFAVGTITDAEMVSAACPNCAMYVVEANNFDASDIEKTAKTAVALGAHIVVAGNGCASTPNCISKKYFDRKGVTYIGNGGFPFQNGPEQFPADFDSVVATGGTYLTKGGGGKRGWTETIWSNYGGGCFTDVSKPAWQKNTACSGRDANDVAIVASNLAWYDSYGGYGWARISGTGVPRGLIAGVFGLAGNATSQDGGRTFWSKKHRKHLYAIPCQASCVMGDYSYSAGWGSPHGIGAF